MAIASFPQSIFGRLTYLQEQAKMYKIMQDVGSATLALAPEVILGVPLPIPKRVRYEKAKKYLKDAKKKLGEMGV